MKVYKFVFGHAGSTYYAAGRTLEEAAKKARKVAKKELQDPMFRSAEYLGELCP